MLNSSQVAELELRRGTANDKSRILSIAPQLSSYKESIYPSHPVSLPPFLPPLPFASFRQCCCSSTKSCPTFCSPVHSAHQASLSFTLSRSLLKLMSIESMMPSNHLILCRCLLLLPLVFPSIKVFSYDSALHIR